jgi:IS5 family transposase
MRTALLILFLGFPLAAVAQVYKWTDASGHVHYSDQAPSDQAKAIKGTAAPSNDASAAQRELAEKDLAFKKRKEDAARAKEEADKEAERARIKQETCERARRNLAALDQGGSTYTSGPYGQRNYMTDQQRVDARVEAEKLMTESCN